MTRSSESPYHNAHMGRLLISWGDTVLPLGRILEKAFSQIEDIHDKRQGGFQPLGPKHTPAPLVHDGEHLVHGLLVAKPDHVVQGPCIRRA